LVPASTDVFLFLGETAKVLERIGRKLFRELLWTPLKERT